MSQEIHITLNFLVQNGNYSDSWRIGALALDQTNQGATAGIAITSTSAANIDYGSIATADVGYILFQNLDGTNSCDVGHTVSSTFYGINRLKPTEHAMFRVTPNLQLQLKAVAGTPKIQYWLLQA